MTVAETIADRVTRLPPKRQEEVLDFVEFLAGRESDVNLGAEWDAKLARRVRGIEDGRVRGLPAEEVIREMRAKYG